MTTITEPLSTTVGTVEHPDWCSPWLCSVQLPSGPHSFSLGDHHGGVKSLNTDFGTNLSVGLAREHEVEEVTVIVISTSIDEPDNPGAYNEERLLPEEARLLARRLLEAADAVEAAR